MDEGIESDAMRDEYFAKAGIKVLRYSNADIKQRFECVCEDVLQNIVARTTGKQEKASPWGEAVERSETDEVSENLTVALRPTSHPLHFVQHLPLKGEGFLFSPKPKFCGGKFTENPYLVVWKNSEKIFQKMQKNACILRSFAVL